LLLKNFPEDLEGKEGMPVMYALIKITGADFPQAHRIFNYFDS
jgi:hypothetical protein